MLSEDVIERNKQEFLSILEKAVTSREGANWEGLKKKLESSDFFTAPASTKFHSCFKGGLCLHSLITYDNMKNLVQVKGFGEIIPEDTIAIVALLHDMSKINNYTITSRNKKVYSESGSKFDELGRFDWVAEQAYAVLPDEERFLYGNHEETSEYMVRTFIPLRYEESIAILHHHGGQGFDSCQNQVASKIMGRYPLTTFLHLSDMMAVYIDENLLV